MHYLVPASTALFVVFKQQPELLFVFFSKTVFPQKYFAGCLQGISSSYGAGN